MASPPSVLANVFRVVAAAQSPSLTLDGVTIGYRDRTIHDEASIDETWFRDPELTDPFGVSVHAQASTFTDGLSAQMQENTTDDANTSESSWNVFYTDSSGVKNPLLNRN